MGCWFLIQDPRISEESRQRFLLRGYEVKSLLLAPIHDADGEVVGLVEVCDRHCLSAVRELL